MTEPERKLLQWLASRAIENYDWKGIPQYVVFLKRALLECGLDYDGDRPDLIEGLKGFDQTNKE
jgi:hypothetical protein